MHAFLTGTTAVLCFVLLRDDAWHSSQLTYIQYSTHSTVYNRGIGRGESERTVGKCVTAEFNG